MAAGVPGLNVLDVHNIHIVIGTEVQFVAEALQNYFLVRWRRPRHLMLNQRPRLNRKLLL